MAICAPTIFMALLLRLGWWNIMWICTRIKHGMYLHASYFLSLRSVKPIRLSVCLLVNGVGTVLISYIQNYSAMRLLRLRPLLHIPLLLLLIHLRRKLNFSSGAQALLNREIAISKNFDFDASNELKEVGE